MTTRDAIELLEADHRKVRDLLNRLEAARQPRQRLRLLAEIEKEINMHSTVEEEIFYPAFKEAVTTDRGTDLFYESHEEHHLVDVVMAEINEIEPGSEEFRAKAVLLKELILRHAGEEEKEMFALARRHLPKRELRSLGHDIRERKEELDEPVSRAIELVVREPGAAPSQHGRRTSRSARAPSMSRARREHIERARE